MVLVPSSACICHAVFLPAAVILRITLDSVRYSLTTIWLIGLPVTPPCHITTAALFLFCTPHTPGHYYRSCSTTVEPVPLLTVIVIPVIVLVWWVLFYSTTLILYYVNSNSNSMMSPIVMPMPLLLFYLEDTFPIVVVWCHAVYFTLCLLYAACRCVILTGCLYVTFCTRLGSLLHCTRFFILLWRPFGMHALAHACLLPFALCLGFAAWHAHVCLCFPFPPAPLLPCLTCATARSIFVFSCLYTFLRFSFTHTVSWVLPPLLLL